MTMTTTPTPTTGGPLPAAQPRFPERQSLPGSADRNAPSIVHALRPLVQDTAATTRQPALRVLELASGPGTHVAALAADWSQSTPSGVDIVVQPTEADAYLCSKIDSTVRSTAPALGPTVTVRPACILDLTSHDDWHALRRAHEDTDAEALFDVVLAFNLLHITPFEVTHELFTQLDPRLSPPLHNQTHGWIAFYGAFKEHEDDVLSDGNAKFDADIRSRNPAFGIRSVSAVQTIASQHGYALSQRIPMPSNNWILVFRPAARTAS